MSYTHLKEDQKLLPHSSSVSSMPKAGDTLSQQWAQGTDLTSGRVKLEPEIAQVAVFPKRSPGPGWEQLCSVAANKVVRRERRKPPILDTFMPQTSKRVLESTFIASNNLLPSELPISFQVFLAECVPPLPWDYGWLFLLQF